MNNDEKPIESDHNKVIEDLLDVIEWETIQKTMKTLEWRWHMEDKEYRYPTVNDPRKRARNMLQDVAKETSDTSLCSGGLMAQKWHGKLSIYFTPTYADQSDLG